MSNSAAGTDQVFRALADPTRRDILDRLARVPGLSLTELGRGLKMSRFGVMKHVGVLVDASLVTTRKVGRQRHHYLNPVPLEEAVGRWVDQVARQQAQALLALRDVMEGGTAMGPVRHQIIIKADLQQVWDAITQPEFTEQYFFGTRILIGTRTGEPVRYKMPDGSTAVDGEVLAFEPPRRLVLSWHVRYDEEMAAEAASRVTFELEPVGDFTRLTVEHGNFPDKSRVRESVDLGWPLVLSNLKTLLETGAPMGSIAGLAY